MIPDGNKTGKAVYIVTLKRILAKLLFPPEAPLVSVSCPIGILNVLKFVYDTPNSLTRSGKSMVTDPQNDHQPLPAPYQPAYHCSVWHRLPPVLYGHHHHTVQHKGAHSLCRWDVAARLLKLYARAAPSPRPRMVPPDLSFYGDEQQELQQGWTVLTPDSLVPRCAD